jgi:molybdenum-dependent DNA-binding transcriptional regulator ModE
MPRGTPLTTEQIRALGASYAKSRNVAHAARKHGVSYAAAWKAIHGAKNDRRRYLQERAVERGLRDGRRALVANGNAIAALLATELLSGSVEPSHVAALQSAHSSTQRELVRQSLLELKRKQAALTREKTRAEIRALRERVKELPPLAELRARMTPRQLAALVVLFGDDELDVAEHVLASPSNPAG